MAIKRQLRGRPSLALELREVLTAIRRHGKALRAARELGCSDAYVHGRLKQAGLTLQEVLDARDVEQLLANVKTRQRDE